jgi:hemoglobin/transferrin/lactoferrin receptor protein
MVSRHLRSTLATCTALAVFSLAHGASAQQAAQPQADTTLRPIVLKGKRVKAGDPAGNTPLASTTTADEIRKKDIGSLQDLGRTTEPGVDYVDTKPGGPVAFSSAAWAVHASSRSSITFRSSISRISPVKGRRRPA